MDPLSVAALPLRKSPSPLCALLESVDNATVPDIKSVLLPDCSTTLPPVFVVPCPAVVCIEPPTTPSPLMRRMCGALTLCAEEPPVILIVPALSAEPVIIC